MCLAIPGKVLSIKKESSPLMGTVSFGGIEKEVCLDWLPDVRIDEYVIVHVGFAISTMDESEAQQVFEYLKSLEVSGEIEELHNSP